MWFWQRLREWWNQVGWVVLVEEVVVGKIRVMGQLWLCWGGQYAGCEKGMVPVNGHEEARRSVWPGGLGRADGGEWCL